MITCLDCQTQNGRPATIAIMNPQQKAIANVFLDMVSAVDSTGETALPSDWLSPFANRLAELDAISVSRDEDNATSHVDMSPLVSSSALLAGVLVNALASQLDADPLAVVHTIREHIEQNL